MNTPKVSIQIPCYNQSHCIKRAIDSALAQTYEFIEVIVCDDQSQDESYAIAKAIVDPKFKVYQNEKNIGRVANYRHLLYDLVSGDWVVNLDGDDWFTDVDYIKRAVELVVANPSVVWYHANQRKLSSIPKLIKTERLDEATLKMNGLDYVQIHSKIKHVFHVSSMYKRSVALDAGFYTSQSLNSDYVSLMKLCKYGDVIQSSRQVAVWDLNHNSASMRNNILKEHVIKKRAVDEMVDFFANVFDSEQLENLRKSHQELHNYYFNTSEILLSDQWTAVKKLIQYASFNKDYFRMLAMYLSKRILKIRKL